MSRKNSILNSGYATYYGLDGSKSMDSQIVSDTEMCIRERVEAEINEHTRAIMVTNPGNPTGCVLTPEEMRMMVRCV